MVQMPVGYKDSATSSNHWLNSSDADTLVDAVMENQSGMNLCTIFSDIGTSGHYRAWQPYSPGGVDRSGDMKENALRGIVEMITFRQNIFTIIVAAQALSDDGKGVLAEKRAMAIVYRDAYTGQSFVRLFKWLSK